MPQTIRTHLMFDGDAEAAMDFYVSVFAGSAVLERERYTEGELAGRLKMGSFRLADQTFICIDTPVKQDFGFTPAMSLFVDCVDDAELEAAFTTLAAGGQVLMPLDDYGFSRRFGWVSDRYGVSWQLNLP